MIRWFFRAHGRAQVFGAEDTVCPGRALLPCERRGGRVGATGFFGERDRRRFGGAADR